MRILHVLDHSIPLQSGYSFRTLNLLHEQRHMGWQTFHLTSPKHAMRCELEETVDGWHFYRTTVAQGPRMAGLSEVLLMQALETRLMHVARMVKPGVIHAHSPVLNALPALRVGRRLGLPVVYEVRAFWEDAAVDHGTTTEGSLRYRLTRRMETRALRQADHVFTICEGLRRDIVARGIPERQVTVIPNAVDVESFSAGAQPDTLLKTALGLEGATVLGFIGSFYAYEGLDVLLGAMPALLACRPETRLLLVGGGPAEATLKQQANALGLSGKVVFAGRVSNTEVRRYYDLVDVLCYPRKSMRLTELVTPLKPLEAMAQGKLVVASDVGGHRELVSDGQTGVLFKAGSVQSLVDKLATLLDQRSTWPDVQARARRFVERERTWNASASRYRAPIEALVNARAETS